MPKQNELRKYFSQVAELLMAGSRCGIISCRVCGAAILLDDRDKEDFAQRHIDWHRGNENA